MFEFGYTWFKQKLYVISDKAIQTNPLSLHRFHHLCNNLCGSWFSASLTVFGDLVYIN